MTRRKQIWCDLGRILCGLVCLVEVSSALGQTHKPIEVGSKRFTESYLLGQILADRLAEVGPAEHRVGLGNTAVTLAALQTGAIDCYPEYLGTIEFEILHRQHASGDLTDVNRALASMGLVATAPLGFSDRYALAVGAKTAKRLHLVRISDLAAHPELRFGLSQEFLGRSDGWPGLAQRYGLRQTPRGIDHGLAYQALAAGQVDVVDVYSTDAHIARDHLEVLDDDLHFFPNYAALVLARRALREDDPVAWQALQSLSGRIDQPRMIAMNSAVELDGRDFHQVAHDFVAGTAIAPRPKAAPSWLDKLFAPDLLALSIEHLRLVAIAVSAAVLIGLPLGIAAFGSQLLRGPILGLTGVLQTIPSLALLAFLIPLMGRIGIWPALVALFLYGLLPIVRNTATGLAGVPQGLVQAACALGLTRTQCMMLVQLPMAAPVILAGVKTATILAIGTATLAALIGAGGFGERITIGLALNDNAMLLAGAIPAAALAVIAECTFALVEKRLLWRRAQRTRRA